MDHPVVFTHRAEVRMRERSATAEQVLEAIRLGDREPAKHGRVLYRLNREFNQEWDGRLYRIQQVAPVVVHETDRIVVVTVYTFYFQEESP